MATRSGRPDAAANITKRGWFKLQVLAGVCDPITDEKSGNVLRDEDGRPKVKPRHNFHRLRHFHASMLIADGANPLEVSKEIGHSDVAFTLSVYGHLFQDEEANKRRQERSERLAASLGR